MIFEEGDQVPPFYVNLAHIHSADVAVTLRGATTIATDMAEIVFMNGTLGQLPELFAPADEFAANMRVNL